MSNKALYKYERELPLFYMELEENLTDEKLSVLRATLSKMTLKDWYAWRKEHESLICDFASRTPKQAAKLKKFSEHWPLLQFACIQMCLETQAVIRALNRSQLCELQMQTRDVISVGSDAYLEFLSELTDNWPLDGEPPFAD